MQNNSFDFSTEEKFFLKTIFKTLFEKNMITKNEYLLALHIIT